MTNWKEYKLGEIAEIKNGKSRPKESGNIPVYGGNGILDYSDASNVSGKTIIIGRVGAYCGSVYFENREIWVSDNALYAKPKNGFDSKYLYYLLKQDNLNQYAGGSSHPLLTQGRLNDLKFNLPDLPTQIAIAEILSSLDDKIELNNKINQELENLTQTLFKQWFIDFEFPNENGEPYKSSGGEMVDSELGEIPKGWEVSEIGLVAKLGAGGDKPKIVSDVPTEEINVPIYSNGITNDGLYGYTDKAKIFEESVTISARGTIGFVCLRSTPFFPIVRLISAIADEKYISTKFLYMWLKNQNIYGNGTTQQQLTVPDFKSSKIIIPTLILVEEYTDQMNGIIENINFNKLENQELTNLRDTLLPKLISGELEVVEVMGEKA